MTGMKLKAVSLLGLMLCSTGLVRKQVDEAAARKPVEAFYAAFNEGFTGAADFATEDWAHINPFGGWTRGRENILKEVRDAHATFLKGAAVAIAEMEVRFASSDAAVVTVISTGTGTFTTPDGVKHEPGGRAIQTFVVVKRETRWLVMQDQNTLIANLR